MRKGSCNMAKYLTLDGLQTFWNGVKSKLNMKVDKVDGKGLSTNDLTNELKAQYDTAYQYASTTDAEKNKIETVKVNGVALTPDEDRAVDVTVPTGALASKDVVAESDLAVDLANKINGKADAATTLAGYGIADAYTKTETDTAISTAVAGASHLKKVLSTAEEIAAFEAAPETANVDTIYMLKDESVTGSDKYKEYTVIGDAFVCIGDTSVDLTPYVLASDIVAITDEEINAMFEEA